MSTATTSKSAKSSAVAPPDEKFWKRYSPHGEAPLSLAGSFTLHLAVGGGMLLLGMFLISGFNHDRTKVPVDPVSLKPGGGGGDPKSKGSDGGPAGSNATDKMEEKGTEDFTNPLGKDEDYKPAPALTPAEMKQIESKYDAADLRPIQMTESGKAFARLDEGIRSKLSDGIRSGSKGQGGTGSGGGQDKGKDKGKGGGEGEGRMTNREKRMLRWHMAFSATTGTEYLNQLKGLGAILAFPMSGGANPQYKVARDLRFGAPLQDDDLAGNDRIYWIDDKPNSVADIIRALGAKLPVIPPRFIAFMPKELESRLYEMEKNHVTKIMRQPWDEDKIDETHFRVVFKRGRFQPDLVSVNMRR